MLELLELVGKDYPSYQLGKYRCYCGKEFIAKTYNVNRDNTKSCGCLQKGKVTERNYKHGKSFTKEHRCWSNIKDRCHNPNYKFYKDYGGRGIIVCDRWRESFDNFYEDMGDAPSSKHSIHRINNNGNYEPNNCKWATTKEQNNETRQNVKISYNDKTQTVAQWAEEYGIKYSLLRDRLKAGYSLEEALDSKLFKNKVFFEYNGEKLYIAEISRKYNIPDKTLRSRLDAGWDIEKAITTPIKKKRGE